MRIPDPDEYRPGDEHHPGSPHYREPSEAEELTERIEALEAEIEDLSDEVDDLEDGLRHGGLAASEVVELRQSRERLVEARAELSSAEEALSLCDDGPDPDEWEARREEHEAEEWLRAL